MILVIVTKYFRVRVRVSVLKNTQMILVIVTKYFRVRVLKNTQMILVIVTKNKIKT
jgi:hypothetical protein